MKVDSIGALIWSKIYGGANTEDMGSLQPTSDGGYILAGTTNSFGAGGNDIYLIRTGVNGDTLWTKCIGGPNADNGNFAQQTFDGEFVVAGTTIISGYYPSAYFIKTDPNGNLVWTKTFDFGTYEDYAYYVQQTNDSGYVITGGANTDYNYACTFLIKTDVNGDTLWTKRYVTPNFVGVLICGKSVKQISNGDYILLAGTNYTSFGYSGIYLIKTNNNGDTIWTKHYDYYELIAKAIYPTLDGGYIIAGYSDDTPVASYIFLVKTNSTGDTLWTKQYETNSSTWEYAYDVISTADSGYALVGNIYTLWWSIFFKNR